MLWQKAQVHFCSRRGSNECRYTIFSITALRILIPSRSQLNAKKKEIVDTDALIERYRKEIEDLKGKLAEREAEAPARTRRLSAREVISACHCVIPNRLIFVTANR